MGNNGVVLEKKRPKVAPGEMESLTLKKEMFSDTDELCFSLEVL